MVSVLRSTGVALQRARGASGRAECLAAHDCAAAFLRRLLADAPDAFCGALGSLGDLTGDDAMRAVEHDVHKQARAQVQAQQQTLMAQQAPQQVFVA